MSDSPTLAFSRWHGPPHLSLFPPSLLLLHPMNSASFALDPRTPEGQVRQKQTYRLVTVSDVIGLHKHDFRAAPSGVRGQLTVLPDLRSGFFCGEQIL